MHLVSLLDVVVVVVAAADGGGGGGAVAGRSIRTFWLHPWPWLALAADERAHRWATFFLLLSHLVSVTTSWRYCALFWLQ